jgi:hypothetical protein
VCPNGKAEWSDVTPLEFPSTDSFLYVNQDSGHNFLYLMYDFPVRLTPLGAGESVHVTFNTVSSDTGTPHLEQYDVDIFAGAPIQVRDQGQLIPAGRIAGAAGFGPSPNSATLHVVAELQVPLTPGAPTAYSPEPLFWSATLPPTPPPDPCRTDDHKRFNRCVKHDMNVSLLVDGLLIAALTVAAGECTALTIGGCAAAEVWMIRAIAALTAVAAGLGYEIAEDPPGLDFTLPPDPNFTVIAQPVAHTLSITTAGLTPDEVAASNAFTANVQQLVSLQQAEVTAVARAEGARLAGNTFWENNQTQAALTFGGQAAPLYAALPGLVSNVGSAIKASGVSSTFTAADVAKFQAAIDPNAPPSEPQQELALAEQLIAQQLGISSTEQALFTPLIRSADPQQVATLGNGTFPGALSDPTFAQAFQALGSDLVKNAPSPKSLNPSFQFTLNGDYVANGVGLRGGTAPSFGPPLTSGNIAISGIPAGATVARAFLYWGLLDNGLNPAANQVTLNGKPVAGSLLGSGPDTCWGRTNSFTFRAEVTPLVAGNGTYTIGGIPTGAALLPEGASLVVIYQAAGLPTKTVMLADGNVSIPSGVSTSTASFSGFSSAGPVAATTTFMVGDGQLQQFGPTRASFTGSLGTLNIPGLFAANNGPLWDTDTVNVSTLVGAGSSSSSATVQVTGDCVLWSAQAFSVTSAPVTTPVAQTAAVVEANATGDTIVNPRGLSPSDAPTLTDRITSIVQFRTIQDPTISSTTLTNQLVNGLVNDGVISAGNASSIQTAVLQNVVKPTAADTTPPSCALTAVIAGPPKQLQITVQDSDGGLKSIVVATITNATVNIPAFTLGTTSPVVVTATKMDQTMGASVTLQATDVAGNVTTCDPAMVTVNGSAGKPVSKVVTGLAQAESTVSIYNNTPGVKQIDVKVNGKLFKVTRLHDGEVRTIDVAAGLKAGNHNTIVLTPRGSSGSAEVLISDMGKHTAAQHGTRHFVVDHEEQEESAPLD